MNPLLRLALVLGVAMACGVALWDRGSGAGRRRPVAPAAPPPTVAALLPAGGERELLRALAAVLAAPLRSELVVATAVTSAVLLDRAIPPDRVTHGRGVRWLDLDPTARALVMRLVEHVAAFARGDGAPALVAGFRAADEPGFVIAVAGALREPGPLYLRLHGAAFVAEWIELAPGQVHCRWREFGPDADARWLRDELADRLGR
ncbi:MAG: hypothetical protein WBO45_12525 [Planctomycetota bacterium]